MRRQQICVRQKMHKNYATHIEVLQNNNNHMRTQKNQKRHDEAKSSLTNSRFITTIEARCEDVSTWKMIFLTLLINLCFGEVNIMICR